MTHTKIHCGKRREEREKHQNINKQIRFYCIWNWLCSFSNFCSIGIYESGWNFFEIFPLQKCSKMIILRGKDWFFLLIVMLKQYFVSLLFVKKQLCCWFFFCCLKIRCDYFFWVFSSCVLLFEYFCQVDEFLFLFCTWFLRKEYIQIHVSQFGWRRVQIKFDFLSYICFVHSWSLSFFLSGALQNSNCTTFAWIGAQHFALPSIPSSHHFFSVLLH